MVSMGVSVKNCIKAVEILTQCLMAKIRRGVNDDFAAIVRQQDRWASPAVAGIGRTADFTAAGKRWDAHGSAGTEDGDLKAAVVGAPLDVSR